MIRRNATFLPLYSLMLGLLALLGFAAIAAGTSVFGTDGVANAQLAVPHLFEENFPSWFAGVAYSAIAIGALVPSAIMSIAAANLFTRNIYRDFINPAATHHQEAKVSKIASLVVKFGALLFVLALDKQNAINMQLLGGVWILQTLVAIVAGLYTRWFHRWALLAGWAVGHALRDDHGIQRRGAQDADQARRRSAGDRGPRHPPLRWLAGELPVHRHQGLHRHLGAGHQHVVAAVVTVVLRALKAPEGTEATSPADYYADGADLAAASKKVSV